MRIKSQIIPSSAALLAVVVSLVGGCSASKDDAAPGTNAGTDGGGGGGSDGGGGPQKEAGGEGGTCGSAPYVAPAPKASTCAGTAAFGAASKVAGSTDAPSAGGLGVAVGDLDGDGKLDFVATIANKVFVYFGQGDGTFASPVTIVSKRFTIFNEAPVVIADFDGDGKLDISATGGIGGTDELFPIVWLNTGSRIFGLANQDSSFSAFNEHPDGTVRPYGNAIAADLDGDGLTDLVYCGYGVRVYTSRCGGISLGSTIPFNGDKDGYNSENCQVTKLNDGDSIPDLIIQSFSGKDKGRTSVLHGNGDGSFSKEVDYENSGQYAVLADVDNDKVLDLVLHNTTGEVGTDKLGVMKGKPDGTFTLLPGIFPVGATGAARPQIVTADFNADGKVDVLIVDHIVDGRAQLLRGNGDGTFAAVTQVAIVTQSDAIPAVGDFNDDGLPDLIAADGNDASVSLNRCH